MLLETSEVRIFISSISHGSHRYPVRQWCLRLEILQLLRSWKSSLTIEKPSNVPLRLYWAVSWLVAGFAKLHRINMSQLCVKKFLAWEVSPAGSTHQQYHSFLLAWPFGLAMFFPYLLLRVESKLTNVICRPDLYENVYDKVVLDKLACWSIQAYVLA